MPSWGLPAPQRGRRPGGSPRPAGPGRMHAALAGPLLAALLATARARPQPLDGGQCRPPGSVSERLPGHSPGLPGTAARGDDGLGSCLLHPPPPTRSTSARQVLPRAPFPGFCRPGSSSAGEPGWALLQLTLTLLGSPQLLVLLGWFLCAPFSPLSCLYPPVFFLPTVTLFLLFLCIKPFSPIHTLPPPSLPGSPALHSDLRHTFFPSAVFHVSLPFQPRPQHPLFQMPYFRGQEKQCQEIDAVLIFPWG